MSPPFRHWTTKYLGLKFRMKGRTFSGVDCWGLICLVYEYELGVALDSHLDAYQDISPKEVGTAIRENYREKWVDTSKPLEFDVVILQVRGVPLHVGLVTDPDKKEFLHISEGIDASIERWDSKRWYNRILAFVRHESIRGQENDKPGTSRIN